ncbi:MAG: DUF1697 domain-containing protein [Deltaproteobacteria bacterium]|nr:DUF1697 domain-containing protein [Deltaproteobacteria bacterium]
MKYISLLRSINVSGQKKIKMADLRALYDGLGYEKVITYIQSGNVIFDSSEKKTGGIKSAIESAIEVEYGFHVPVHIGRVEEYEEIINRCPFEEASLEENGSKILISFLSSVPEESKIIELMKYAKLPERLIVNGSVVFLYCPNGYGRSKLSNSFLESKLSVEATTRNWKTVRKLYELSTQ